MVEVISALAGHLPWGSLGDGQGVELAEVTGHDMVQMAWWRDTDMMARAVLDEVLALTAGTGAGGARKSGDVTVFPVRPGAVWITAPASAGLRDRLAGSPLTGFGTITELGHAYTLLRLSGPRAPALLSRHVAVDVHPAVFPPGCCVSTSLAQVQVLLHNAADGGRGCIFDLYLPRSQALALFQPLAATARIINAAFTS